MIALKQMPDWPAAMDWQTALAYLGIAEAALRGYVRAGRVRFLPLGPNGKRVTRRSEVDRLLIEIWEAAPASLAEDFDFGDD